MCIIAAQDVCKQFIVVLMAVFYDCKNCDKHNDEQSSRSITITDLAAIKFET
jgi:hypothetical protein